MKNPQLTPYSVVENQKLPAKMNNKTRMPASANSIQHSTSCSSYKERKGIQIKGKTEAISIHRYLVLYMENAKESTRIVGANK